MLRRMPSLNNNALKINVRSISLTIPSKNEVNASTTESQNKLEYYKKLGAASQKDTRPKNWDEAIPFEKIPGPKPWPIVGNLWRFAIPKIGQYHGKERLDLMRTLNEQYGDVLVLKGLPRQPALVSIYNPDDFETLFRNEGPWPIRPTFNSLLHYRTVTRKDKFKEYPGLVVSHGEEWFKFRTVANPILMQPRNILKYVDRVDSITNQLIDNIHFFATTRENSEMPENFLQELYKWALDNVTAVFLEKEFGVLDRNSGEDSEGQKLIKAAVEILDLFYELDFKPSLKSPIESSKKWFRYVELSDFLIDVGTKYVDQMKIKIKDASSQSKDGNEEGILEKLLKVNEDVAFVVTMDGLAAGVDTTGKTLAAALYYLAKTPEAQANLRQEALNLLPSKKSPVTKEVLANAPYLRAVIKETMRLAPIGVQNGRETAKDLVLGGYQIPKGTRVVLNNLLACKSEKYFTRPEEFIPERWLKETTGELSHKNANPFVYLPFGFGPRSCVGKRLATLEIETAILKIARNFELSWPHEDAAFKSLLLYGIASPLKYHVKPVEN